MQSDSSPSIETIIQQGYTVKIGEYIRQGWELYKQNIGGFILFTLIWAIANSVGGSSQRTSTLGAVVSLVLGGPLTAGFYIVAFKLIRNRTTTFSDFFRGFNNFLPLFLAYLLTGVLIAIGCFFLLIPGIYLAVAYVFTIPFIVARRMDFWEAMETSRRLITKNWFSFFGLMLVLFLLNMVGALCLVVGLLVTVPLSFCTIAAAYTDIVGLPVSSDPILE